MRLLTTFVALALVTGCSSIRVVKKTPDGGIVALQGAQDGAREKAEQYMSGQCPGGYDVVEEGEAVSGSETTAETHKTFLGPVTEAKTKDTHEWRITYKCKGAAKSAAAETVIVRF